MTESEDCFCCCYVPEPENEFLKTMALEIKYFLDGRLMALKMVESYKTKFSIDFTTGDLIMKLNVELKKAEN